MAETELCFVGFLKTFLFLRHRVSIVTCNRPSLIRTRGVQFFPSLRYLADFRKAKSYLSLSTLFRRHISNVNHYSESYYFLEKYHANSSNPINIPDSYHRFLGGKNGDALSSEFFLPTERIGESVASLTTRSNRFIPAPNNLENRNDRDWNDSNDICLSSLV